MTIVLIAIAFLAACAVAAGLVTLILRAGNARHR